MSWKYGMTSCFIAWLLVMDASAAGGVANVCVLTRCWARHKDAPIIVKEGAWPFTAMLHNLEKRGDTMATSAAPKPAGAGCSPRLLRLATIGYASAYAASRTSAGSIEMAVEVSGSARQSSLKVVRVASCRRKNGRKYSDCCTRTWPLYLAGTNVHTNNTRSLYEYESKLRSLPSMITVHPIHITDAISMSIMSIILYR
eukprot:scaffold146025_cov19-Prasinocladus_malaysianus.AAC.1